MKVSSPDADEADRAAFEAWLRDSRERKDLHASLVRSFAALDAAAANPTIFDERLAGVIARGKTEPPSAEEPGESPALRVPIRAPYARTRADDAARFWHWSIARRVVTAIVASVVGVSLATAAWRQLTAPRYTAMATAVGDIRKVNLADGSGVYINTDTHLAYVVTDSRRLVRMDRGEVYFQVAKDRSRPFVVAVGKYEITVTGTAFDVKYLDGVAELMVTEGVTRLSRRGLVLGLGGGDDAVVPAGVRATFADNKPVALTRQADVESAGSWRTGTLVYRDKPLIEIIADLDRYLPSRLVLTRVEETTGAARKHFTVRLPVSDEATMLNRIRLLLPVTLREVRRGVYEVDLK
jgi:transmembrane sensor